MEKYLVDEYIVADLKGGESILSFSESKNHKKV